MKIDDQLIDKLGSLAFLSFSDDEKRKMIEDLNAMFVLIEKVNELDTEGVEPLIHISKEINRYREDKITNTISKDKALKNAPKHDSDYFRVPKVLKK